MGFVNHIIPDGQVCVGFNPLPAGREFFRSRFPFGSSPQQLRVRQDCKLQARILHSCGKRADPDTAVAVIGQLFHFRTDEYRHLVLPQIALKDFRPPLVSGKKHHPVTLFPVDLQVLGRGLGVSGIGRQLFGRNAEQRPGPESSPAQRKSIRRKNRKALQFIPDFLRGKTELLRPKGTEPVFLQQPEILSQLLSVVAGHFRAAGRLVHKYQRPGGDIIKTRGGRIQKREPPVQVRHSQAVSHFFGVCSRRCRQTAGEFAVFPTDKPVGQLFQLPAQRLRSARTQCREYLRRREYRNRFHVFLPALGGNVKNSHGIDIIAPEFHPDRPVLRR